MLKIILLLSILIPLSAFSQGKYQTNSKKAIRNFDLALKYFDLKDDANAIKYLGKALKADDKFIDAYMMMAQIYKDKEEYPQAIEYFEKGLEINPKFNPSGYILLANVEYNEGMYREAMLHARKFLSLGIYDKTQASEGEKMVRDCEWAIDRINHPVPFDPVNLGDSVNSQYSEYWPSLSVDENQLFFTVLEPVDPSSPVKKASMQEDFYVSVKNSNGEWRKRTNVGPPINTYDNEGAQTVSADGRYLFFTGCNREDGKGLCDIYYSRNIDGRWSEPVNLGGPVNTAYSEKHPSISSDGRKLFFASDRPGGFGGLDIWCSERRSNGAWSVPVNLGDSINTPLIERSPFIHSDNETLYFSSDGHQNLGKGDIFFSRIRPDGQWSRPVNLGYPINTYNNELGLIVNARGDVAYYSSDRIKERLLDIYTFRLYPEARPVPVSYMKGRVFDARTGISLEALFQLIDLETGQVIVESFSAPQEGDFLISLPVNRDYALNVSKSGYLFYSEHFSFHGIHKITDPFIKDIPLNRIFQGEKTVLNNIFYEFDSWELLPQSFIELNKVVEFLNNNPAIMIEISGHTDSIGTQSYNQELSEKRAKSVIDYLVDKGIKTDRLVFKGFGASQPVSTNDTEEGRAINRRTELKIIN